MAGENRERRQVVSLYQFAKSVVTKHDKLAGRDALSHLVSSKGQTSETKTLAELAASSKGHEGRVCFGPLPLAGGYYLHADTAFPL